MIEYWRFYDRILEILWEYYGVIMGYDYGI